MRGVTSSTDQMKREFMMGDITDYDFDQRDKMCDTDMLPISEMRLEFPNDGKTTILDSPRMAIIS